MTTLYKLVTPPVSAFAPFELGDQIVEFTGDPLWAPGMRWTVDAIRWRSDSATLLTVAQTQRGGRLRLNYYNGQRPTSPMLLCDAHPLRHLGVQMQPNWEGNVRLLFSDDDGNNLWTGDAANFVSFEVQITGVTAQVAAAKQAAAEAAACGR